MNRQEIVLRLNDKMNEVVHDLQGDYTARHLLYLFTEKVRILLGYTPGFLSEEECLYKLPLNDEDSLKLKTLYENLQTSGRDIAYACEGCGLIKTYSGKSYTPLTVVEHLWIFEKITPIIQKIQSAEDLFHERRRY